MTDAQTTIMRRVIASFPATFGLRAFPGETFRISESASYFETLVGAFPTLYTQRLHADGTWRDFAKGSEAELRTQLVTLGGEP